MGPILSAFTNKSLLNNYRSGDKILVDGGTELKNNLFGNNYCLRVCFSACFYCIHDIGAFSKTFLLKYLLPASPEKKPQIVLQKPPKGIS